MKTTKFCNWRSRISPALLAAAALLGVPLEAAAQNPPAVTLATLNNNIVPWGNHLMVPLLRATVSYSGSCATPPSPAANTVVLRASGDPVITAPISMSCSGGVYTGTADIPFDVLYKFGAHFVTAHYGLGASNPVFVTLQPDFMFITVGGTVFSSLATTASTCTQRTAALQLREGLEVDPPPPHLRTPFDHLAYGSINCTFALAPRAGPHAQYAQIELPIDVPAGSEVWVNDYDSTGNSRSWRRVLNPVIRGRQAMFEVFGAGSGIMRQNYIAATATIAIPQLNVREMPMQDLWWGGSDQQGWGLNVAKNGERIFATLFAYQNDGRPMWVVMPEGTWDPIHEVYWGNLYTPSGSSYANYDASRFRMGDPVGVGSLSFSDIDLGRFDYTINGFSGGKNMSRYVFATREAGAPAPPYAGMWWGGPGKDGWGVSIQQQGDTLFATWYTYGADGAVTWFYMPAGRRGTGNTYSGELFRTTGTRWIGQPFYDGSRTNTVRVGTMQLSFANADAATMTTTIDGATLVQPIVRFGF